MDRLRNIFGWFLVAAVALLAIMAACTGCTEQQFNQAEHAAVIAEDAASGVAAVLDSPAGNLIPEPVKSGLRLGLEGLLAFLAWFGLNKARIRGAVLRSVVQAIDAPGDTKQAVKANLRAAGIEEKGRAIINQYKVPMNDVRQS